MGGKGWVTSVLLHPCLLFPSLHQTSSSASPSCSPADITTPNPEDTLVLLLGPNPFLCSAEIRMVFSKNKCLLQKQDRAKLNFYQITKQSEAPEKMPCRGRALFIIADVVLPVPSNPCMSRRIHNSYSVILPWLLAGLRGWAHH